MKDVSEIFNELPDGSAFVDGTVYESECSEERSKIQRRRRIVIDKEFLLWIHTRLVLVHGEDRNMEHMHRLREIIDETPSKHRSPNTIHYALLDSWDDRIDRLRERADKLRDDGRLVTATHLEGNARGHSICYAELKDNLIKAIGEG